MSTTTDQLVDDYLRRLRREVRGLPRARQREIVQEMRWATGRDLHFHPRPLWLSQTMEIGKWLVKKAGRRPGVTFPSYRDLKTRSLAVPFNSRLARETLGWRPVEDREEFLDRTVRIYGRT